MIFPVARLIADLSQGTTLLAGTVILTGTPAGVGAGRKPPRFLRDGDRVEVEISGVGLLSNPVRQRP
jgi:2-keto-4-pentenoate hydratase/2-oxohepta-3-ene-1,7-dioic acid hydratase in catechol pathway